VADAASEIQLARAVGIDVFMVNFGALDTKNWRGLPHYIRMLKAAKQLKNGFSVAPNLDCAGGSSSVTQGTTSAKNVLTFLKNAGELKNPNMFRISGKMVVGTWKYEACSVGFWNAVRDTFAKEGVAVHLMCIAHTKPALASHDAVCDSWGDWGPRTYNASFGANINKLTNQSSEPRVAAIPTMFTHHNQTDGDGWESRATQLMRGVWTEAIKAKVEHAQIVTWNDCMEGSAFEPGTGRQFAVYDMAAYYITWFKTGSAPKIVRDALYYVHRKHPVPKSSAVSWHGPGPTNEIELVGFLTAPGTLEIVTSKGTTKKAVPGGVQAIYAPTPAAGKPRFRLVRAGKAVVDIQSQFAVSAWDASFQDAQYRGGGSRRTQHAGAASAGATCAKRGVEACLSPGLGEPVWLAF
jgi:hypothetical protein